jgi:4-hydroxybenzoate polyprenyltransferase
VLNRDVLAELVRLPAVLSVPGDALLGAAAGGAPRGNLLVASSASLYAGGMALNDWSDRLVDALERPGRPIPSGRIAAAQARAVAVGLLAGGVVSARVLGGRRALRVAVPLAGAVVAYDTRAKQGPRGPALMAACRGLDVLLGAAPGRVLPALPAALVVAAHTANVTTLSQHEVDGADAAVVRRATIAAAGLALVPVLLAVRGGRRRSALAALASAAYAWQCVPPLQRAAQDPAAAQRAVGANVLGIVPLQAGLLVASGARVRAMAVLAILPVARRFAARRRVT